MAAAMASSNGFPVVYDETAIEASSPGKDNDESKRSINLEKHDSSTLGSETRNDRGDEMIESSDDHRVSELSRNPALLFKSFLALPEPERLELVKMLESLAVEEILSGVEQTTAPKDHAHRTSSPTSDKDGENGRWKQATYPALARKYIPGLDRKYIVAPSRESPAIGSPVVLRSCDRSPSPELPKAGTTRMPAQLVSKSAIIDLGYTFDDEGDTIVIPKALSRKNIGQILDFSKNYEASETIESSTHAHGEPYEISRPTRPSYDIPEPLTVTRFQNRAQSELDGRRQLRGRTRSRHRGIVIEVSPHRLDDGKDYRANDLHNARNKTEMVNEIFVNHFGKIGLRAKSFSPHRRPRSLSGETRFLESVISKKTLIQNGYAFGIEKGEVVIDQALDHDSINDLIDKELSHQNDERDLTAVGTVVRAHALDRDLDSHDPLTAGNAHFVRPTPVRPVRGPLPANPRDRPRGRTVMINDESTSARTLSSEGDQNISGKDLRTKFAIVSVNEAAAQMPQHSYRGYRYPDVERESAHRIRSGPSEPYFEKRLPFAEGRVHYDKNTDVDIETARLSRRPASYESVPEVDADGWLLGMRYEKRVHDPSGRTHFESALQEDLAKIVTWDSDDPEDAPIGGRDKQEYVIHIIREYQSGEDTYRNELKNKSDYLGTTVEVRSILLIDLFKKIAPYYPEQSLEGATISFPEPQRFLFQHLSIFRDYVANENGESDKATKKHVEILLKCLEEIDSSEDSIIKTIDGINNKTFGLRTIPFSHVWSIFKPGTIIVRRFSPDFDIRAFVVHSLSGHEKTYRRGGQAAYATLWINCWSIQYNEAGFFTRKMDKIPLEPYQGAIDVESLDIVPLDYCAENEKMRTMLVERGRRYWTLKRRNYMEYVNGPRSSLGDNKTVRVMIDLCAYKAHLKRIMNAKQAANATANEVSSLFGDVSDQGSGSKLDHTDPEDDSDNEDPPELKHRSRKLHTLMDPSSKSKSNGKPQTLYSQCGYMHEDDTPTDEQLILCRSHVWGYSFREKNWGLYAVEKLYKVEFKKKSFDRLVMNDYYKDIVRAMVANHIQEDSNQFRDLVDGKGQGVVILLHGPPGVGKTLTAECIADLYERPLIAVTCGDIGTNPDVLEAKLEDVFRRAEEWGAVLLLDEADVFLAERNLESLERNALVSIFLRTLEYFNGILFLTTNRIGTIDEAFQSRLHVTLGLSALSVEDRKQVWYNFLAGLKHLSRDDRKELIKKSRSDWAQQPLNGRQIRNCVRTALVLARQEQVPVNQSHFERVIKLGNDYAKYLTKLKKMDMEHLAEAMGTRLKAFSKESRTSMNRPAPDQGLGSRVMSASKMSIAGVEDEELSESDRDFHM